MRLQWFQLSCVLIAICVIPACSQDAQRNREIHDSSLLTLNERFNSAAKEWNNDSILELYSDDALWLAPNARIVHGSDAIRTNYDFLKKNNALLSHTLEYSYVSKDKSQAVMIGQYVVKIPAMGFSDSGKYQFTLRRKHNQWEIVADMFSSSLPAAPPKN